jgi:hypothetical protein
MSDDLSLPAATYEREFWKRYHSLRQMIDHLREEEVLIHRIKAATIIPEQARDMAMRAILGELADKRRIFLEFFYDFVGFCSQGLHRADIFIEFTVLSGGISEIHSCRIFIDQHREDLPMEIGRRFIDMIPVAEGWKAVLAYYRNEETRFDRMYGGILGRCSLTITEELFPSPCHHIAIRLPAVTLLEKGNQSGQD